MLGKVRKVARRTGRIVWTQFEESGAIMAGVPVDLDQGKTGDKFAPSPVVREVSESVTETRTIHARGVAK